MRRYLRIKINAKYGLILSDEYLIYDLLSRFQHFGNCFRFGVYMELVVNIADMCADGADADKIFFSNFFIAQPFHQ